MLRVLLIRIRVANRRDLVHRAEEGVEQAGLELTAAKLSHDRNGLVERQSGAVHAVARQRVEDVGDRGDPGRLRNLLALQPPGVAGAIPPFMVSQCDLGRGAQKLRGRAGE